MAEKDQALIDLVPEIKFPLSLGGFHAWCAAFSTTAVELVVFTREGQVVLLPRPDTDPFFAGQVHGPGTLITPLDLSKQAIFDRLLRKEIGGKELLTPPTFIDWGVFPSGDGPEENVRGHEVWLLHGSIYLGDELPEGATLGDPENLPGNLIIYHRVLIRRAYEWFEATEHGLALAADQLA